MSARPAKPRVVVVADQRKGGVRDAIAGSLALIDRHATLVAVDLDLCLDLSAVRADRLIAFGGDGTILSAARRMKHRQIPVIGVNLGRFGFMAEFSVSELRDRLGQLLSGDYPISQRMMLECRVVRGKECLLSSLALNEVAVSRGALSRLISISLSIDGEQVNSFSGDGLIVSTPVGSTAHSLAAGGPILDPHLEAFVITGICPHTLSHRPLVIPAGRKIELEVEEAPVVVAVTLDGQIYEELRAGDRVQVRKARQSFKLIETPLRTYYQTLREKLGWRGEPEYAPRSRS